LIAGGFDDLILKPCLPDVLADEVERVVKRTRRVNQGEVTTQPAA
jgi:DNA-binding response OmpR family regulator